MTASSGLAATLYDDGRTAHGAFGIPVPCFSNSTSRIKAHWPQAEELRVAKLIILDEATMSSLDVISCINRLLKFVRKNDLPFGGITIVLSGDFRQTLPIVKHGKRATILEACWKTSALFRENFTTLRLTENMRTGEGEREFSEFLMKLGNGELPLHPELGADMIEILSDMICEGNLIDEIFGEVINEENIDVMAKRAILCPRNDDTLKINDEILKRMPGEARVYASADTVSTIVDTSQEELANYSTEFINSITPSGMPPHLLTLKVGCIIMLL